MTHPQMIRPSAFQPDEEEPAECVECGSRTDVTSVRCQIDADSLCVECMSEHVRSCVRCEQG